MTIPPYLVICGREDRPRKVSSSAVHQTGFYTDGVLSLGPWLLRIGRQRAQDLVIGSTRTTTYLYYVVVEI